MRVPKEKKIEEAVKRMEFLKMSENVIKELQEGIIEESESGGFLYWLDDEQKKIVKDFEDSHNALVWHCVRSWTNFGEMLSLLFISDYEEE